MPWATVYCRHVTHVSWCVALAPPAVTFLMCQILPTETWLLPSAVSGFKAPLPGRISQQNQYCVFFKKPAMKLFLRDMSFIRVGLGRYVFCLLFHQPPLDKHKQKLKKKKKKNLRQYTHIKFIDSIRNYVAVSSHSVKEVQSCIASIMERTVFDYHSFEEWMSEVSLVCTVMKWHLVGHSL